MSPISKAVAKPSVSDGPAVDSKEHLARCATSPSVSAAVIVEAFAKQSVGEQDVASLMNELLEANKEVHGGDLTRAESILMSQTHALQSIFVAMARRSARNAGEYINASETYMRMALKAQNQCRMTLETLATIKNPPVIFAKQANIAHGHQQVNNSAAVTHAAKTENAPNEKEAIRHEQRQTLDTGTASGASGAHPVHQTVAKRHRAKN